MKLIELYIKLKLIGALVILLFITIYLIYCIVTIINNNRKDKLLKQNGFNFVEGLYGAAKEFGSYFIKDDKKIMTRDAYRYSYKKLKEWINK